MLTPAQILNLYKTVVVSTASTFSSIPDSPAGAPGGAPMAGAAAPTIQAVQTFAAPQASVSQQLPATGPVSTSYQASLGSYVSLIGPAHHLQNAKNHVCT